MLTIEKHAWMDRALCVRKQPDMFFPTADESVGQAVSVCCSCPVKSQCRQFGVYEPYGIWGGELHDAIDDESAWSKPLKARCDEPYRSSTPPPTPQGGAAMTTTPAEPQPTTGRGQSAVSKEGNAKCPSCRKQLPVTAFPTVRAKDGTYQRSLAECRSCRKTRRTAQRAEKEGAKSTAA